MRYFLLHVDHSKKLFEGFKTQLKRHARFWVIDLDSSQFSCVPPSKTFDQLTALVKEFCQKTSVDSLAGQNVAAMLKELNYQNIKVEHTPFSTETVPVRELVLYLKQEVQCYARMIGKPATDRGILEILRFLDEEVSLGLFQLSYGMVLVSAELNRGTAESV